MGADSTPTQNTAPLYATVALKLKKKTFKIEYNTGCNINVRL